ncbi:hypothetical protein HanRHA438_Chr16g0735811 [Helianthus annuus]|nr:hypothetical protein HanIR_Chr16g0787101 [Helianthus annuus]KAJ0833722.1 hypothetical protein HanRHA438_Chr16g0735811 [Helianthus annuus]
MKFPLQCFSKIITGTTGLLTAPDSVQGGSGVVTADAAASGSPQPQSKTIKLTSADSSQNNCLWSLLPI